MTTKRLKPFSIEAQINAWIEIKITAESFEDALAQAKTLVPTDFYRPKGECFDHTITLGAVRSADVPDLYR